ncbi:MAG: PilZ domain-containing protein, partial [Myxococcales bacterium]|nr:PilZ domain-containing protein [Myxococcales bacterium]
DLGLNPSRQIERREMPRSTKPFPISFLRADGFCFGLVADISGVGMKVRTPRPAEVGAEVLVHFPEIESGLEYVFPARVVWAQERSMGLRFSGVPIRHDVSA